MSRRDEASSVGALFLEIRDINNSPSNIKPYTHYGLSRSLVKICSPRKIHLPVYSDTQKDVYILQGNGNVFFHLIKHLVQQVCNGNDVGEQ